VPNRQDLKKVMVIGSGPIVIGQAAEFDYAGTQACRALKEEGIEVILVNSNPATIMTDTAIADQVYLEPLTVDYLAQIIRQEQPQGLLPTLGGQVGLNLAMELAEKGILAQEKVELLGTPIDAIKKAEDREGFRSLMTAIKEPIPESAVVCEVEAAEIFAGEIGFPLIIRPAYTLGGSGGGTANNMEELRAIVNRGLKYSRIGQVLVERSVTGWKEIEFEVMRDQAGNGIVVCDMENIDPMGIHTGDSIVVAPSQTLTSGQYHKLRQAALKIIAALGIAGGCNVQFALEPGSEKYYVIEVNPRVSRSSALASKATGYPIARVSTKIALGYTLEEIYQARDPQTGTLFEPRVDYVVVKIPRWPFDKFSPADRRLGTQMKSTGEVMAIDLTFEGALQKAVRSLEIGAIGLALPDSEQWTEADLINKLQQGDDERLFAIASYLKRGASIEKVHSLTGIDSFFLEKINNIVQLASRIERVGYEGLDTETLAVAKRLGFADAFLAQLVGVQEAEIRRQRKELGLLPAYLAVETCAQAFTAVSPYYYSTYIVAPTERPPAERKVIVLGSGPIRIGQGIEFDYCSVHAAWALRKAGYKAIIVNNNPETVSTDADTSDRLYFEPLTLEDVLGIVERENPLGVMVQFGGQTAINLAAGLAAAGVPILGTAQEDIDAAEDRDRFVNLLSELDIPTPPGKAVFSVAEAEAAAAAIGYPVVVRPSYVLGGRAMEIVEHEGELREYMASAARITPEHPVLVDKYLVGRELEVDAVADEETVFIPGVMEHIERAGVHSGDSMAVFPPQNLSPQEIETVVDYTTRLSRALASRGLVNIQFVLHEGEIYVLEVNPRASRTVPILSKVTGVPLVELATQVALGESLAALGYRGGLRPQPDFVAVKVPVFSFAKLTEVDTFLGPEMKSTGEAMGLDRTFPKALYKAFQAVGLSVPERGTILATIADRDKEQALPIIAGFTRLGFDIIATSGTANFLAAHGLRVKQVNKIREGSPHVADILWEGKVDLVINTLTRGKLPQREGFKIRRAAVEMGVPALTSLDTARALLEVLTYMRVGLEPINRYVGS
jgi:carbamoyl-phosphate synthase large subunit